MLQILSMLHHLAILKLAKLIKETSRPPLEETAKTTKNRNRNEATTKVGEMKIKIDFCKSLRINYLKTKIAELETARGRNDPVSIK